MLTANKTAPDSAASASAPVRTPSGIGLPLVATSAHHGHGANGEELPGRYPFTRGIFADGYRGRLWTMRQYAGFATAEESNQRYKFLLARGQTGLSVALDLPTQCGYDPTDPMARPEIGKVGVSLSNLAEMETLFAGIDLSKISTSFTINGTAAIIYAMYVAYADKQGVARDKLTGTIQNDILKEYVARGTWIFPVRPSMRLIADSILYANATTPRFNPISIAGAHVRDAGATAVEEMAYTLANGLAYVDELIARGGDVREIRQAPEFLLLRPHGFLRGGLQVQGGAPAVGAAAPRALRCQRREGAAFPLRRRLRRVLAHRSAALQQRHPRGSRNHGRRPGRRPVDLHGRVRRGAAGCRPNSRPRLALRTQQLIAYESGIANTVDPLGGSHLVEFLTDQMEREMERVMGEIDAYGGVVKAIEEGWLQARIAERALARKLDVDSKRTIVVGVNAFQRDDGGSDGGAVPRLDPGRHPGHFREVRIRTPEARGGPGGASARPFVGGGRR